jgi:hypothetical protein
MDPADHRPRRRQNPTGPRRRKPRRQAQCLPATLRQLAVAGLGHGHDEPTILITNDHTSPAKAIIENYARRMNIEQRLAESIRSFGLDALAGAVPLNIDLDVVLSVLAHTPSAPRYADAYLATPPPPPTSCKDASCKPAAPSSTTATRSPSASTAAPTHPSYVKPTSPPSPRGATAPSTTSSPKTWGPTRCVKIGANH